MFLCLSSFSQIRQYQLGKWTLSARYAIERDSRKLVDNQRSSIDTVSGLTDSTYIAFREKYDETMWGYSVGIMADYRIKPGLWFSTGINYVRAGSIVNLNKVTESEFRSVFYNAWTNDTINTNSNFFEIPLMFKKKIAPNVRFEKEMTGTRLLTLTRILYGGAGLSLAYGTGQDDYYNEMETKGSDASIGLNAIATIGINQLFKYRIRLDAGIDFRRSLTNFYPYAPIFSKYSMMGGHVALGYTFKYKSPKQKKSLDLSCRNFIRTPQPSGDVTFQYGLLFGLNSSFLRGDDAQSDGLGWRGQVPNEMSVYNSVTGGTFPLIRPHVGFSFEYFFAPKVMSLGAVVAYSQKGFMTKHEYTGVNNEGIDVIAKTEARTNIDNVDATVNFKIMPVPHFYLLGGMNFTFPVVGEVYNYHQVVEVIDNESPSWNSSRVGKTKYKSYWGDNLSPFTYGMSLGMGMELDNYVDIMIRYQKHTNLFENNFDMYNQTFQLSVMYTFFNRKIFKEN